MGYTTEQCINTLLAASGPQDFDEIKAECVRQVWGESVTTFSVRKVLQTMVGMQEIFYNGEFYFIHEDELV